MKAGAGPDVAEAFARALARRLAEVEAAGRRLEAFAFNPEEADEPSAAPDKGNDALRDLMLRAMARAADPVNYAVLRRLDGGEASFVDLAHLTGLPKSAVYERANDLVQVGLVARGGRDDRVTLTAAGAALLGLVEEVVRGGAGQ